MESTCRLAVPVSNPVPGKKVASNVPSLFKRAMRPRAAPL